VRRAWLPFEIVRGAVSLVRAAEDVRFDLATRVRALSEALGGSLRLPSETPLNREIGPHRRFDWAVAELGDLKHMRKALGGSLNDLVLTVVTGAVRAFLRGRHVNPDRLDFRVMARCRCATTSAARSATECRRGSCRCRSTSPIPRAQPARIIEKTMRLKESNGAVGADVLTQAAEYTPSTLLALGARNIARLLPFNLVVTNVPGPQAPMYMLGAEMTECYPHVPLTDRLGLGIALMSYNGKLCWGFNGDYDLVPDLREFVAAIEASFRQLQELAGGRPHTNGHDIAARPG
jgi:hypothetical protein